MELLFPRSLAVVARNAKSSFCCFFSIGTNFSAEQQQATLSTSRMLITISVVFLVSMTMLAATGVGRRIALGAPGGANSLVYGLLESFQALPVIVNSSANFPVLFLSMKSFRENLRLVLGLSSNKAPV